MTRVLPFAVHVYSLWYVCTYKCWGAYFLPSLCSASHSGHTRSAYAGTWAGCSTNVTKLYESLQNSKEQKCNTEHVSYCGPTNVRLGATVPEQPGSSDSCTHAYVCVCVRVRARARYTSTPPLGRHGLFWAVLNLHALLSDGSHFAVNPISGCSIVLNLDKKLKIRQHIMSR